MKIYPADRIFSEYIRLRDNWTCKRCLKKYDPNITSHRRALHCSHFKGRGKWGTRFEPLNCDALCYGCHRYFTAQPDEHQKWQIEQKGQDIVDKLTLQANGYHKKDHDQAIKHAQALLNSLNKS